MARQVYGDTYSPQHYATSRKVADSILFLIDLILPATLRPWSRLSNLKKLRNLGVKGGRRVRLTTSLPPVGGSTSHNPLGLHGLSQGQAPSHVLKLLPCNVINILPDYSVPQARRPQSKGNTLHQAS
jgi:hypothetical protein